jgi:exodeoxyribonuclease-5
MGAKILTKSIQTFLGHEFTNCQKQVADQLSNFIQQPNAKDVYIITGYAGTGKTSLISAFIRSLSELKIQTVLMAPTGRAAKVLSGYSNQVANTIHKTIYRQKQSTNATSGFVLNFNTVQQGVFIVDEASMIADSSLQGSLFGSGYLLSDLVEYVFSNRNNKLILIGDKGQLPPVHFEISPALNPQALLAMDCNVISSNMDEVVRQAENSGILYNATVLREHITANNIEFPEIVYDIFNDIERIGGNDLLEFIENSYNTYGIEETRIITRSNKMANLYNAGVRNRILWKEEELSYGDLLMVVKNNYAWLPSGSPISFIANGDMVEVTHIGKYYEQYGYRFADVRIRFVDYPTFEIETRVVIDSLSYNGPGMPQEYSQKIMEQLMIDYEHLGSKKLIDEAILKDPFYNALQIKFAYAITCHKAQGGQWKCVFIDHGYLVAEHLDLSFFRWLYTAFTRSTQKLYLVNFRKEFFKEETNC